MQNTTNAHNIIFRFTVCIATNLHFVANRSEVDALYSALNEPGCGEERNSRRRNRRYNNNNNNTTTTTGSVFFPPQNARRRRLYYFLLLFVVVVLCVFLFFFDGEKIHLPHATYILVLLFAMATHHYKIINLFTWSRRCCFCCV